MPELLFEIYLTGSIASSVGPAVITTFLFLNNFFFLFSKEFISLTISFGSRILPEPISPHA